jgi:hypothetical protein
MPEDVVNPSTTTETSTATPGGQEAVPAKPTGAVSDSTAAAGSAPVQAEGSDWAKFVETVSSEELRRHPRIAGIAGELAQRREAEIRRQIEQEQAEKAAQAERERLRRLRRDDPVAYAEEMESRDELEAAQRNLHRLRGETQQQFLKRITDGLKSLPEWGEMSQDDLAALATALVGKSDDEVLAVFTSKANDLLADKRAMKRFNEWRQKELAKEREAIRTEEAAKLLKGDARPDMMRPKGYPSKFSPADIKDDKQFDEWYEREVLGR